MKKRLEILKVLEKHGALKFNQLKRAVDCNSNTIVNQLQNPDYGLVELGLVEPVEKNYEKKLFGITYKGEIELKELNNEVIRKEIRSNSKNAAGKIIIQTSGKLNEEDKRKIAELENTINEKIKDTSLKDATVSVRMKFWV